MLGTWLPNINHIFVDHEKEHHVNLNNILNQVKNFLYVTFFFVLSFSFISIQSSSGCFNAVSHNEIFVENPREMFRGHYCT